MHLFKFVTLASIVWGFILGFQVDQASADETKTIIKTYYTGYSKKFQPYKEHLCAGNLEDVHKLLVEEEIQLGETCENTDEFVESLGLLRLMERTSLSLQTGDVEKSLVYSQHAENLMDMRESESYANEALAFAGSMVADVFGAGEYGRYDATGYEKVLLLNIKSINYLLLGDDRAYNVARLAIHWQAEEKEEFIEEMTKVTEVAQKEEDKLVEEKGNKARSSSSLVLSALKNEFSKYDDITLSVSNAFVNPFGDYMAGMINEFKSAKLASLIGNAHTSYQQALTLNPDSEVLKRAVEDTKKKEPVSKLIHIVAFDGFVPEKKVLSFNMQIPSLSAPLDIEVPSYVPVDSGVKKIKVKTIEGKELATLSTVANIDALALRYQKDSLPAVYGTLVASTVRDALIKEAGNSVFGGLGSFIGKALDEYQEPDTSCWMSLPSKIQAARIYPSSNLNKVNIISYDGNGETIAKQTVELGEGDLHFVFVRTVGETMYAYPSKSIWSPHESNTPDIAIWTPPLHKSDDKKIVKNEVQDKYEDF